MLTIKSALYLLIIYSAICTTIFIKYNEKLRKKVEYFRERLREERKKKKAGKGEKEKYKIQGEKHHQ